LPLRFSADFLKVTLCLKSNSLLMTVSYLHVGLMFHLMTTFWVQTKVYVPSVTAHTGLYLSYVSRYVATPVTEIGGFV
jgi:hypothetical protein